MIDWTLDPDKVASEPDCPFCNHYMEFKGNSSEGRMQRNLWECVQPRCFRKTVLVLKFEF